MLQVGILPGSLLAVLVAFGPCFTGPSFRTFCALVAGLVAQPARRTLCGMLVGAGLAGVWHHCRAHRFFSRAVWDLSRVSAVLVGLVVDRLVPAGAPVLVAVDDTLFRRSGRKVAAAFWQHDGSVNGPRDAQVGFGNNWLIAGVIVDLPFLSRPTCLPVAFALVTRDGPTKQVLAGRLVTMITGVITAVTAGRQVDVVADSWYAGAAGAVGAARGGTRGRGFPPGVTLTSRLRANAVLTAIATPTPGRAGRPKRIGARLGTPKHLAAQLEAQGAFTPATVRRYGRTDPVLLAEQTVLWYGVYRSRAVRVILVRDINRGPDRAGLLALITTDLTTPADQIVARYAARWSIEVAIADAKQHTGVGQARNRTPTAVARTVPFGLIVQTLVIIWYASHGNHHDTIADRRRQAPWHRDKTEPAYHDMIITLRRTLIAARFRAGTTRQPTPEETLAVHAAWAEAAA
jgi:hypothetical protein